MKFNRPADELGIEQLLVIQRILSLRPLRLGTELRGKRRSRVPQVPTLQERDRPIPCSPKCAPCTQKSTCTATGDICSLSERDESPIRIELHEGFFAWGCDSLENSLNNRGRLRITVVERPASPRRKTPRV